MYPFTCRQTPMRGCAGRRRRGGRMCEGGGGYEEEREYRWKQGELVCSVFMGAASGTTGALNSEFSSDKIECGG
jgi:hypothetical protein